MLGVGLPYHIKKPGIDADLFIYCYRLLAFEKGEITLTLKINTYTIFSNQQNLCHFMKELK